MSESVAVLNARGGAFVSNVPSFRSDRQPTTDDIAGVPFP